MNRNQLARRVLNLSSVFLLSWASIYAQATVKQNTHECTIVFVCEHGSAKSVIAATHFNDLAQKNGLPYRAVARGVHPDKEIPLYVKNGLAGEGLTIHDQQPIRFSEEEARGAERVVTLGCALPSATSARARQLQDWKDVPSPSENYEKASRNIAERVTLLLRSLSGQQALP
jgi:arsenate reductase